MLIRIKHTLKLVKLCQISYQKMNQNAEMIPHVLIFPLPIQGPVNSMLKLAELLTLSTNDIHVTFLTTDHVYGRLVDRFRQCHPRLSVQTFSDGLPEDHPRGGEKFLEMLDMVKHVSQPLLVKMLTKGLIKSPAFTCIVADGLFDFALDVGNEAVIPVLYFDSMSPCSIWVYMCLPRLFQAGQVPIKGNEETLVDVVPGMEGFLRRRDLPDFCRGRDEADHIMIQRVLAQVNQYQRAHGIILNTFEDLEPELLSYMRSHCKSQVYTIGPLHFHLQKKLQQISCMPKNSLLAPSKRSNSFWQEDASCMAWLAKKSPRSVIFCSFGSQVVVTKEQLIEFWYGLVNSGRFFLWVKRPGSVIGMDDDYEKWSKEISKDLIDGISQKGCIVSWAPQEEVLSHPTVGGFLTHSGWNSTIESISCGVPMICWPLYVDQLVSSRVVSEVWKIGVDIKDTCGRVTIEKKIKDVMGLRKHEFLENATKLANLARISVDVGGFSEQSLGCLIEDIRSCKLFVPNSRI